VQEGVETTDNSPTFSQPVIPIQKSLTFVPISFELFEDGLNIMEELGILSNDGFEQLQARRVRKRHRNRAAHGVHHLAGRRLHQHCK
jgi:hypothetical protein